MALEIMKPHFLQEEVGFSFLRKEACQSIKFMILPASNIPGELSRVHAYIRGKKPPNTPGEAICLTKNQQDVKEIFWKRVETGNLQVSEDKIKT